MFTYCFSYLGIASSILGLVSSYLGLVYSFLGIAATFFLSFSTIVMLGPFLGISAMIGLLDFFGITGDLSAALVLL